MESIVFEYRRAVGRGDLVDHGALDEGVLHRGHEPDDGNGDSNGREQHANGNDQASHEGPSLCSRPLAYTDQTGRG
jgi:hypothetical protein